MKDLELGFGCFGWFRMFMGSKGHPLEKEGHYLRELGG